MTSSASNMIAPCLNGFEKVHRYWDSSYASAVAKLNPGDFYVTTHDEAITTVLGSCVSACIRDVGLNVGGMNHFMLPIKGSIYDKSALVSDALRYGNWAMEFLINEILKVGGRRRSLEVKLFGGGNVVEGLSADVGLKNVDFALKYLFDENLNVVSKDVGGKQARQIIYFPKTGKVKMKYVQDLKSTNLAEQEVVYFKAITKSAVSGDMELF